MTREFVLNKMSFHEFMLYYSIGVTEHLKLHGLYIKPEGEERKKSNKEPVISSDGDHNAIYEYYHNQKFDPSRLPEDVKMMYYARK